MEHKVKLTAYTGTAAKHIGGSTTTTLFSFGQTKKTMKTESKFEKVETIKGGLAGVVIGEVLTKEKHPDADKLNVTTVNIGSDEPLQIVCGAPNVEVGQKVVVVTVGSTLYPAPDESFKI